MPKIIQNYEGCIGCGSCAAVCQDFWDMDYEKGKAILKGGKKTRKQGNMSWKSVISRAIKKQSMCARLQL